MKQRRREALEEAPINLTPLIDVVFVILIMFIVVAPLLEIDRISLAEGSARQQPAGQEQNLVIHVYPDDTLSFNSRPVTLQQLEALLAQARVKFPTGKPQLVQDQRATFGAYQSVKNAVELAGFSEMDVLLKPK